MEKINNIPISRKVKCFCIGFAVAFAIVILLTILAAICFSSFSLSLRLMPIVSAIILTIGCFIGGMVNAILVKKQGIICGAEISAVFSILVLCISSFLQKDFISLITLCKIVAFMTFGILGGIMGVNINTKRVKY